MALQRRRPGPGPVRHGDRGVRYAAEPWSGAASSGRRAARATVPTTRRRRASSPRPRRRTSTTSASAPGRRPGRRCSSMSRSSTTGSACTRPRAAAPRPRRGPAGKGPTCARPRDVLVPPLHSSGGGPLVRSLASMSAGRTTRSRPTSGRSVMLHRRAIALDLLASHRLGAQHLEAIGLPILRVGHLPAAHQQAGQGAILAQLVVDRSVGPYASFPPS
jgi:hypothetical protein